MFRLWIWFFTLASPLWAQSLVGWHRGATSLVLSPDGRFLESWHDDDYADVRPESPPRRYDLRRGGWRLGFGGGEWDWLSQNDRVFPMGTATENGVSDQSFDSYAPIVGVSRVNSSRPPRIFREKNLVNGDSLLQTTLSRDVGTLSVFSTQFRRDFDFSTGHLKRRWRWPKAFKTARRVISVSPDGQWLLSQEKGAVVLRDSNGVLIRHLKNRSLNDVQVSWSRFGRTWLSPEIFALGRSLGEKQPRNTTEFYSAVTGRRLWVLADVRRRAWVADTSDGGRRYLHHFWQPLLLIGEGNSVITGGPNHWVWRDLKTGRVQGEAAAPRASDIFPDSFVRVSGNEFFWIDRKGRIWRDRFR